ncbi:unnamed protein product [Effrenium voratum]|nr:unnamed protein product [Effrenium voratum]
MAWPLLLFATFSVAFSSNLRHRRGSLVSHAAHPHRNNHIHRSEPSNEVHLLRSSDVEPQEHEHAPRKQERRKASRSPSEPIVEVTDLSLQKLAGKEVDGIDIDIVKVSSNMVLPSTYSVSLVTTTAGPSFQKRGDCVCQQGHFLHWSSKECVPQKPWGFECGFFPRQQQNRVCQDGLACKRLNATDEYESSGKYKGWTATAPASCEYCTKDDDCTTGMERHLADCVRSGDLKRMEEEAEDEDAEVEPWEDSEVFEEWGHKGSDIADANPQDLDGFGRREPKMCVTVKVTVPALTVRDRSTRIIEAKLNTTLEVIANATQKAKANASATAKSRRQAVAEVQAEANASYHATAYAEATYTAYAEAKDRATATYKAVATAEAKKDENGDLEATAVAKSDGSASATKIANATRTERAKGEAGVLVKLKQTGHGQASAEAEERAVARVEDTETVVKNATLNVEGVGSIKKAFKATATAKAIVEAKACISARQARKMLSQETMKQSGVPFARSVYKKAEREAYAEAKDRATRMAVDMATKAAQKRIDEDIERQVQDYTEAHRKELERIALADAVNSTKDEKDVLQAAALKEAMQKAVEKVRAKAPEEAQRLADAKAKKAAEDQATKLATEEAQEEARLGLEKKAVIKAREEAQDKANEDAKTKAFAKAKAAAEEAAKDSAAKAAGDAAELDAVQRARKKAEESAVKNAVAKANRAISEEEPKLKEPEPKSKEPESEKAARRQRQLAELKTETADLSQGIESIENSTDSAVLIQALRQELVALKEEVELQQKANSLLTGLQGEDKRRAAQRAALKILQQEATKLQFAKSNMEKGEKRAALVQRCLEEVHARLDSCKIGKQQAEEEISQLKPAYAELGHQLDVAETERRFLQGELDKLRQASGGLRAEILHLQEVRSAVDALPPEELTASKRVAGGSLERLALLQRRLGAAAPQLVPLCTRARAEMEELLKCSQHLEQRQLRLHQVANRPGSDPGNACASSCSKVKWPLALVLMDKARAQGLELTSVTLNCGLQALVHAQKSPTTSWPLSLVLLRSQLGVQRDTVSWNSASDAMSKANAERWTLATELMSCMATRAVEQDSFSASVAARSLGNWPDALRICRGAVGDFLFDRPTLCPWPPSQAEAVR